MKHTEDLSGLDHVEATKLNSRFLRGTIAESLADPVTGALRAVDAELIRYHGSYQQDDRDLREERRSQKLEPAWQFMIRVRVPAGIVTPAQWLAMDALTRQHGSGSLRITSRQTFQVHRILKENLKAAIAAVNACLLDTFATSGDVNRNVICSSNPMAAAQHAALLQWARTISAHLLPKTNAYRELWLDAERVDPAAESEPLYGRRYLPRKFKIAIAAPPTNDIDVFKDDIGLIAIFQGDLLSGFNVLAGGGLSTTQGDATTYPRLADPLGFVPCERLIAVVEQILGIQRDRGDRASRTHARLKYTIDRMGIDAFKTELESRLGFRFAPMQPYHFDTTGDRFGWTQSTDGLQHLCLHLAAGRVGNDSGSRALDGLREIARVHAGHFRLTSNQNVIIANIRPADRAQIGELVRQFGLDGYRRLEPLPRDALSCVALPTCPLAMAEAERYLPHLLARVTALTAKHGLAEQPILLRLSGCPNSCSRSYMGEIGLIGRAPGRYDLRLGADSRGTRLNSLHRENLDEDAILAALDEIFARYAQERQPHEEFGNFVVRAAIVEAGEAPSAAEGDALQAASAVRALQ